MPQSFALSVVSNDAFREIFQSMTEGIVVVNRDGSILVVNKVVEEMFGYDTGDLNGKNLEILLPERYRSGHLKHRLGFNEAPSPRRMGLGRDLPALKKDGQEFPVEISLSHSEATLAYNSVRQRIAEALLKLTSANNQVDKIQVSREDLAKMVGTAPESVIRGLSDFKEEGLIEIENGKIKVLQPACLEKVVRWNVAL